MWSCCCPVSGSDLSYAKKMQLGQLLFHAGHWESAKKVFIQASNLSSSAEPHFSLIHIYVRQQQYAEAIKEAEIITKIHPRNVKVLLVQSGLLCLQAESLTEREKRASLERSTDLLQRAKKLGAKQTDFEWILQSLRRQGSGKDD